MKKKKGKSTKPPKSGGTIERLAELRRKEAEEREKKK